MLAVTRTALARRASAQVLMTLARLMLTQPVRARRAPDRPVVAQVPTVLRVPVLALPAWMGPRPAAPLASHRLRRVSAG